MSQYAALLAHSNRLGVQPIISAGMKSMLSPHFPNISIPASTMDCSWNWFVLELDDVYQLSKADFEFNNFYITDYIFDLNSFNLYQHQLISKEFVFDSAVLTEAQSFLSRIASDANRNEEIAKDIIYTSVHVRRTDYQTWMNSYVNGFTASRQFYISAMDQMRSQYNSQVSVLPTYWRKSSEHGKKEECHFNNICTEKYYTFKGTAFAQGSIY